jgi:hypothetical protein
MFAPCRPESLKLETEHLKLVSKFQFASCMQLACHNPDRIMEPQKLNFSRECRMQIYAIYFQKTRVGRGSDQKNQKCLC